MAAVVAAQLGSGAPMIGGPIFGILLGTRWPRCCVRARGSDLERVASKPLLQLSIVLLGATLSLQQVAAVGVARFP